VLKKEGGRERGRKGRKEAGKSIILIKQGAEISITDF
jgi:hypothetical protein